MPTINEFEHRKMQIIYQETLAGPWNVALHLSLFPQWQYWIKESHDIAIEEDKGVDQSPNLNTRIQTLLSIPGGCDLLMNAYSYRSQKHKETCTPIYEPYD